tara:strand:+ start:382 stop:954 length:573 start_codon:yes stop_codon:yes gene_type:complete
LGLKELIQQDLLLLLLLAVVVGLQLPMVVLVDQAVVTVVWKMVEALQPLRGILAAVLDLVVLVVMVKVVPTITLVEAAVLEVLAQQEVAVHQGPAERVKITAEHLELLVEQVVSLPEAEAEVWIIVVAVEPEVQAAAEQVVQIIRMALLLQQTPDQVVGVVLVVCRVLMAQEVLLPLDTTQLLGLSRSTT